MTTFLAKVDDKVAMEETGIEDERTLARYKRFSDAERREMLAKTDYIVQTFEVDVVEGTLADMAKFGGTT